MLNISKLFKCDISGGIFSIFDLLRMSVFKFYSFRMVRRDFRLDIFEAYNSYNCMSLIIF